LEPGPKSGKDNKTPYDTATGRKASTANPATWTALEGALKAKDKYGFTGVGFVFAHGGGIVGVDIDHCLDPASGELNDAAACILARIPATYVEVSPSGTGLHIFMRGQIPEGGNKNSKTGVEMYAHSRYFTMTGGAYKCAPKIVAGDDGALAWIHETYIKPPRKAAAKKKARGKARAPLDDGEVVEKASASEDFLALWEGRWEDNYASQSEADMALCRKLAFWTGKNKEQMDRLFRQSKLMRGKWDAVHHASGATYGGETLDKAIEAVTDDYSSENGSSVFEYEGRYFRDKGGKLVPLTNFTVRPIEMIASEDETQLTADLVTAGGEVFRQTFMTADFANPQKFKNVLNKRTIALSYTGSENDLEFLKGYVSSLAWPTKTGVKAMGLYEHGGRMVFVSPEGAVAAGGSKVEDIVQMEKHRRVECGILAARTLGKSQLLEVGEHILSYNEPAKTVSILAWCAGYFIKPQLKKAGVKFPHLFLIGEAGSGKSNTLERVILPVFSKAKVVAASQVTAFTLLKDSASSNIAPLPLDEFKPSKLDRAKLNILCNHFRDSYDGHEGVRGRADQSAAAYELFAPLAVAGEESPDEPSVKERSIELLFSKKDLKHPQRRLSFNRLRSGGDLLRGLGRGLLEAALSTGAGEAGAWHAEASGLFSPEFPARLVDNLAACYCGVRLLEKLCRMLGAQWQEVFPHSMADCQRNLETAAREYLLDGGEANKSVLEEAFEIMSRMGLAYNMEYAFDKGGAVLCLWLSHVYDRYTKYRKDYAVGGEALSYPQFKKQLAHSDIFLASNVARRMGGELKKVWLLDYAALKARCDVSGFENTGAQPLGT
jgi:hypothetical protein